MPLNHVSIRHMYHPRICVYHPFIYHYDNLKGQFCTIAKFGQIFNDMIYQNAQKINIYFQHIIKFYQRKSLFNFMQQQLK